MKVRYSDSGRSDKPNLLTRRDLLTDFGKWRSG